MPHLHVNLSTLQTRLTERWDSSAFWTTEEATSAINESIRLWQAMTGMWKQRATVTTVANQVYYSAPSPLLNVFRIEYNGKALNKTSLEILDNARPHWEGQTTATSGVPSRPMLWVPIGLKTFAIWPAHAAGNVALAVDGLRTAPTLTYPDDMIDIGKEELDVILDYALHIAAFKGDKARWKQTDSFRKAFIQAAMNKNSRIAASSLFKKAIQKDHEKDFRPLK